MRIQVLGSGCPTCKKLHKNTTEAVNNLQIEAEVEYISDIQTIIESGFISTPVLAIDGKAVLVGKVPNTKEVEKIIEDHL